MTSPLSSLSTRSAITNSRSQATLPYPTSTASSIPIVSPALSTSGAPDGSNGNGSPTSSASLSSSAETTEDDPTTSISSPTIPITSGPLLAPSPLPGAPSSTSISPPSTGPHHLNTGAIVGIVLGALAALLASAIALFLLRRRARRSGRSKSKHTSVESSESRQRLEACSYSDGTSRPASSVLTFGSALTPGGPDYAYEPKREPSENFPALAETRPLAGDASVHSLHEGLLGAPAPFGPDVPSASSELLALAGTEFAMVNSLNLNDGGGGGGLRRSGSGRSRTTASSGEVQSVEAL